MPGEVALPSGRPPFLGTALPSVARPRGWRGSVPVPVSIAGRTEPLGGAVGGRPWVESAYRYSDAVAVLAVAIMVSSATWPGMAGGDAGSLRPALFVGALVWCWPLLGALAGLYNPGPRLHPREAANRVASVAGWGSVFPLIYVLSVGGSGVAAALMFWGGATSVALLLRAAIRWAAADAADDAVREVIIVGTGPRAARLHREVSQQAYPRVEVIGVVDDADLGLAADAGLPLLGAPEHLETLLMQHVVDEVLIALPIKSRYGVIQQVITACERAGTQSKYVADLFRCSVARPRYEQGEAGPVLSNRLVADDYRLGLKRVIDVVVAASALVALAPLFALIAAGVRLTSPGPAIFAQERCGLNKRRFRIYKFRTMVNRAESLQDGLELQNEATGPVFKIRGDPRVTPFGRFLRRSSLDELPQLWNVLRGDMSLVGPRPLPVRDVRRFDEPWLMRRFSVRPGITCLWQVGGRSHVGFDDWVALDLQYIDRWSLLQDFRILLRTVPAVLGGKGAM